MSLIRLKCLSRPYHVSLSAGQNQKEAGWYSKYLSPVNVALDIKNVGVEGTDSYSVAEVMGFSSLGTYLK